MSTLVSRRYVLSRGFAWQCGLAAWLAVMVFVGWRIDQQRWEISGVVTWLVQLNIGLGKIFFSPLLVLYAWLADLLMLSSAQGSWPLLVGVVFAAWSMLLTPLGLAIHLPERRKGLLTLQGGVLLAYGILVGVTMRYLILGWIAESS